MTERKRSRDIFEKLATERKWYQPLYGLTRSDFTDEYLDLYLQHRWEGWQAMEEIMVNNINKALEPVQESLETPSQQCIEKIITPVECFTRLAELVAKTERSDNDEFDYASMMSHAYNFTDQYLHPAESSPIDWRQFHVGCCNGNHSKPLGGPMCVCHPHKLNEIITQQQIRIRELEAESSPKPKCKYGDPGCPCQDGDECHYEGENPWPPPKPAESPRKLTWAEETMHMINELTPDIKGKAFDPDWFLLRQRLEEFERATPSPEPPSNPICGICNMPLSDHEKLTKRCPVGHWDFAETVFTKSGQDIVKEAFDALTPERTEEILNEVEAKFGPDRPSPEPPSNDDHRQRAIEECMAIASECEDDDKTAGAVYMEIKDRLLRSKD